MHRVFPTVLLAATLFAAPLHAGFVLDDFDDPAEVTLEGEPVVTSGVGDLSASRTLSIFDIFTTPQARLDVSVTQPSHLTLTRSSAAPGEELGLGRFGPIYRFDDVPQDFTQGGQNNAFFIDIASISGPTLPPLLYSFVWDNGGGFEAFFDLRNFTAPSTIVLPFSQYRLRAGGIPTTNFDDVTQISFSVVGNGTVNSVLEQGWTLVSSRVRVGRIPEPTSLAIALMGLPLFFGHRRLL